MSNILRFTKETTDDSCIPTEMSVIAATKLMERCGGQEVPSGLESHSIYVAFPLQDEEGEKHTAYGRTRLDDSGEAIIVAQFLEDVDPVMGFAVGDTHEDRCGCKSEVVDLATLATAFEREYALMDVLPNPRVRSSAMEGISIQTLAAALGIDISDGPSPIGDLPGS